MTERNEHGSAAPSETRSNVIAYPRNRNLFRRRELDGFEDVSLTACNLLDLIKAHGNTSGLDYYDNSGNRIVVSGPINEKSIKKTTIYLSGGNNTIILNGLKGVARLDVACVGGGSVSVSNPYTVRGVTIFCTQGASVDIANGCMASRDILIYSSKSHGLYSSITGARRPKSTVEIQERVWLGQGAKLLTGARVGGGSVIGAFSVLAGKVPNNCAAAGNPCRVLTENIFWTGNAVPNDGNYFEMLEKEGLPMPDFVRRTNDQL